MNEIEASDTNTDSTHDGEGTAAFANAPGAGDGKRGSRQDSPADQPSEANSVGAEPDSPVGPETGADWRDAVGDPGLRRQLDRYGSIEDLARHNLTLRRRLSRAITPPGEEAAPEEVAAFRARMGVPESADGYAYDPPADLPDEIAAAAGEDELAEIFDVAHGLGLSQAQLSGLLDWRYDRLGALGMEMQAQQAAAREKSERDLRREWGGDFERNLNLSRRACREFGGERFAAFLGRARVDGTQLANHPEIVRWAARVGQALTEGTLQMGGEGGGASPEERRAELTRQIHDARAAGDSARARELDAERRDLTGRIYGER